jgi:hypothetical protein
MKKLLDLYAADIKYGFDLAGASDLYLPFLDQLKTATFEEKSLPIGDKLMWMLFRSHGKVKIVQDIEWAGKEPLEVFAFNVVKDYKNYEFVMPRPCGNISLRSITILEKPAAVCAISVTPAKVNLKDPVTVDLSGCQNAQSMAVDVLGPDGAKITTLPNGRRVSISRGIIPLKPRPPTRTARFQQTRAKPLSMSTLRQPAS